MRIIMSSLICYNIDKEISNRIFFIKFKGGNKMATKSILKNINIKSRKTTTSLLNALENAKKKGSKKFEYSRGIRTASSEDIKKIFGD